MLGAVGTGALSSFSGTILAQGAITLGAGSLLVGQALSRGTVTLAGNTIRFTAALPPTISIAGGSEAVTKDTTPLIAGTSSAVDGRTVQVTVGGQSLATTLTGGAWQVTAGALAAGSYVVVARVRDAASNAAVATQTLTVEVNPAPVTLDSTEPFSVLAGTMITNTGATKVSGDVGVSPGTAVSGFPQGAVAGDVHAGDGVAADAQTDLLAAINEAAGCTPHTQFSGDLARKDLPRRRAPHCHCPGPDRIAHPRRGRSGRGLHLPGRRCGEYGRVQLSDPGQWRQGVERVLAGAGRRRHRRLVVVLRHDPG